MSGSVSLTLDRQRRLLTYLAKGFLTDIDVAWVSDEKAALLRSLGGDPTDHLTIADVSECQIQSQAVAARLAVMISDRRLMARRMAFVTGTGSLVRMQVRRLVQHAETAHLFDDRESAEAWLFD